MPEKQIKHTVEKLAGGTLVLANSQHPITTDSLLLAAFCSLRPGWRVCDLGCGCGILLLALADMGLCACGIGIEQNPEALALLRGAITLNQLPNLSAICADYRGYKSPFQFDLVVANPPYFSQGQTAASPARAGARHEVYTSLAEVCAHAARLLKDGGRLCLCYPAQRMARVFACFAAAGIAPKRMQLVRKNAQSPPWLLLLEGRKGGGEGLGILPELLLQGAHSPAKNLFGPALAGQS